MKMGFAEKIIFSTTTLIFIFVCQNAFSATTGIVSGRVAVTVCGNGIKNVGEQCDGNDFDGASCTSLGFSGGNLSCTSSCEFDTTTIGTCYTSANVSTYQTPSSENGANYILEDTGSILNVSLPEQFYSEDLSFYIFSHNADDFPENTVPSFKDFANNVFSLVFVNSNGETVHQLEKPISVTLNYPANITSNIDENSLEPYRREAGQDFWTKITNFTLNKDTKSITFSTKDFSLFTILGNKKTSGGRSNTSGISYSPEEIPLPVTEEEKQKIIKKADFNKSGEVDMQDFSILLFYFGKTGKEIEGYDLNSDGIIDITDVSILLYWWDIIS